MTLACHHVPKETASSCQPRCVHCGIMIGQARCYACLGFGCWSLSGMLMDCPTCEGRGFRWVELRTFVPTPGNRSEGET